MYNTQTFPHLKQNDRHHHLHICLPDPLPLPLQWKLSKWYISQTSPQGLKTWIMWSQKKRSVISHNASFTSYLFHTSSLQSIAPHLSTSIIASWPVYRQYITVDLLCVPYCLPILHRQPSPLFVSLPTIFISWPTNCVPTPYCLPILHRQPSPLFVSLPTIFISWPTNSMYLHLIVYLLFTCSPPSIRLIVDACRKNLDSTQQDMFAEHTCPLPQNDIITVL